MSVLKQYNTLTSEWEVIAVGTQGDAGITTGTVAPANTAVLWLDTDDNADVMPVPSGGSAGQVLAKATNTDYDSAWIDRTGSGNVLLNADFTINQRGFTTLSSATTSPGAFTFDRYTITHGGTTGTAVYSSEVFGTVASPLPSYSLSPFLQVVTSAHSNADSWAGISHLLESSKTLSGQVVTFSFYARAATGTPKLGLRFQQNFGSGGSGTATVYKTVNAISNNFERYSVTFTMPSVEGKAINAVSSLINISMVFTAGSTTYEGSFGSMNQNNTFQTWGWQLEAGSTATPFRRNAPSIQAELAACQRYYWRSNAGSDGFSIGGFGLGASSTQILLTFTPPVNMRTSVSSVDYALAGWADGTSSGSASSLSIPSSQPNSIKVLMTTSGITQYRPYFAQQYGVGVGYIGFSAEL